MGTPNQIEKLTNYITIEPSSLDGLFLSHPVHTVIAPGLCKPMTLGLPFLTTDNIVCNYAERTCTATQSKPPYNLLSEVNKTKPTLRLMMTPNILAALKEWIVTLSFEEELAAREAKICKHFAWIFEPPPHFNELPMC